MKSQDKKYINALKKRIDNINSLSNSLYLLIIGILLGIIGSAFSDILFDIVKKLSKFGLIYAYPIYIIIIGLTLAFLLIWLINKFKFINKELKETIRHRKDMTEFFEFLDNAKKKK